MPRWSRFIVLSLVILGPAPFEAFAGPMLSFQPRIRGTTTTSAHVFYRLPDGSHVDIEWRVTARTPATLISPYVQANEPVLVGGSIGLDDDNDFSEWSILPFVPPPPGISSLQVTERADTDGPLPRGPSKRWRLGVTGTYSGVGGPGTEDSFTDGGASVIVDVFDADYPIDIRGGTTGTAVSAATLGWQFTVSNQTRVAALGFWDEGPSGIGSHTVALWNSAGGAPLAALEVDETDDDFPSTESAGRWIFKTLPNPVVIAPGTYVIGATYAANDPDAFRVSSLLNPLSVTTTPGLTFDGSRSTSGSVLSIAAGPQFPDLYVAGESAYFGPNFLIDPVPEPHSIVLVLTGGLAIALRAIRRRRRE